MPAGDVLDLSNLPAFAGADLNGVLARSTQVGADVVVDLGDGQAGQVTLVGVQMSVLSTDDFLFV